MLSLHHQLCRVKRKVAWIMACIAPRTTKCVEHIGPQNGCQHFQVAGLQAGVMLERLLLQVSENLHESERCRGVVKADQICSEAL